MNNVTLELGDVYKAGDIFIMKEDGLQCEIYILATPVYEGKTPKYVAINLEDGNRWSEMTEDANKAVEGLTFYKSNAFITVK